MLNISHNKLNEKVTIENYNSGKKLLNKKYRKQFNKMLLIFIIGIIIVMFLPWTQNIAGKGNVTTLKPNQRPQSVQSQIPGRIEEWFVQEGDYVKKGDTILRISEIKSDYFDEKLIQRTSDQIQSKSQSIASYTEKVKALKRQVIALKKERVLKLKQAKNKIIQANLKVKNDSTDLVAAKINIKIAQRQFDRTKTLQNEGLKALKDVEEKRLKFQETQAKLISQENKWIASKNNVINAQIEITKINAEYADKIAKAESSKFTAESDKFDVEAQVSKLENSRANYKRRNSLLYITASQNGYLNKAIKSGIGETFKEGERLISIMPADYELAVETYVEPIDLPLIHIGEKVRVQFDGWPAIVFSGWPNVSSGTFGAEVVAIESFISENGKFRILLKPDNSEENPWPKAIRIGSGAKTMALLNNVPIWYEIWRQLNGFPPNFYKPATNKTEKKK